MPNLTGVRERRQRTGVKSGEFADLVGYSRSAFISVENGTRPASVEAANRIAERLTALGVSTTVTDLITSGGTVPDRPHPQPKSPPAPPKRQDKEGPNKGPKRVDGTAA